MSACPKPANRSTTGSTCANAAALRGPQAARGARDGGALARRVSEAERMEYGAGMLGAIFMVPPSAGCRRPRGTRAAAREGRAVDGGRDAVLVVVLAGRALRGSRRASRHARRRSCRRRREPDAADAADAPGAVDAADARDAAGAADVAEPGEDARRADDADAERDAGAADHRRAAGDAALPTTPCAATPAEPTTPAAPTTPDRAGDGRGADHPGRRSPRSEDRGRPTRVERQLTPPPRPLRGGSRREITLETPLPAIETP